MIKINYFDERELLVRREIETKTPKATEAKGTQVLPLSKGGTSMPLKLERHVTLDVCEPLDQSYT